MYEDDYFSQRVGVGHLACWLKVAAIGTTEDSSAVVNTVEELLALGVIPRVAFSATAQLLFVRFDAALQFLDVLLRR